MTDLRKNPGENYALPVAVILTLVFALLLTARGTATTMDSLYYLEAAQNFIQGHGVSQPNFSLNETKAYNPVTMWPPLYPMALAPFLTLSDNAETAAGYFNTIFLLVAVIIFFLILRRSLGRTTAAVLSLFFAIQPAVITVYTYAWSETLFIPLVLLSYYCGLRYLETAGRSDRGQEKLWLALGAVSLGLAANTRYIGVAFVPALWVVIYFGRIPFQKKLLHSLAVGTIVLLSLLPLAIRNYWYSGYLSGAERGKPPPHYVEDAVSLGKVLLLNLLHFPTTIIILLTLLLAGVVAYVVIRTKGASSLRSLLPAAVLLPLVWVLVYSAALIVLRGAQTIDLDTRMISVIVPFILLAVIGMAYRFTSLGNPAVVLAPFFLWTVFQIAQGYTTYDRAIKAWQSGQALLYATDKIAYTNLRLSRFALAGQVLYDEMRKTRGDFIVFNEWRPMLFRHLFNARVKQVPLPLTAATIALINDVGGKNGVLWMTSAEGVNELARIYGTDLKHLQLVKEAKAMGATVVALPLPAP